LPDPAFDAAYSWGSQLGDTALSQLPDLQQLTPASYSWTVNTMAADTTAPDTSIGTKPPATTDQTTASFSWSGTDNVGGSGVDHYLYQLDNGDWISSNTTTTSFSGLSNGSHTFQVEAVDAAGNTDATPASYSWTVNTVAQDTSIVGTAAADKLSGSGTNDILVGGGGADTLTGGQGKDTFTYNATTDSTPAAADTITDFTHGVDKIDFTNIAGINASGGVPQFQGNITGNGNGNLRLAAHSVAYIEVGGNTEVLVNTSNAAEKVTTTDTHAADMQIHLVGVNLGLTASDFHHV
jgi:Ca2+-binding RTX toxin-like protein